MEDSLVSAYEVTDTVITEYWRNWYFVHYGVSYKLFYWYYLGNGEFDMDGFLAH